jgi:hypothetical protein
VQRYYDEGHSITQCQERFGMARKTFSDAVLRGHVRTRPQAPPIESLLVAGRKTHRWHLRRRLVAAGLKSDVCEGCGIVDWRGTPVAFELHHVNGDGNDNRLENLQILCPNCHSQTDNWGGRNSRRRAA